MSERIALRVMMFVAVAAVSACSSAPMVPPFDGSLPLGTWGGEAAGMIVGDTAMHVHVGCTYGDVSGRVPVGDGGTFDVEGSYVLQAYPVMVGPKLPARFTGRQDGTHTTITITVSDTVEHKMVVLGPVTLTYGREPQDMPCPICRRPVVTKKAASRPAERGASRASRTPLVAMRPGQPEPWFR